MIAFLCASVFASQSSDFNDRVAEMLLLEASSRLSLPSTQMELLHLGLQNTSCPEDAHIDIHIPPSEDFRGSIDVYVSAQDESGQCGKWRTQSRVAIYKHAYVAQSAIAPGQAIQMEKKLARYDLSVGTLISDADTPLEAKTHIRKGEVITVERSRTVPDARDGMRVDIIVKSGDLNIKSDGQLMGNAYLGDSVKVISMATRQVIEGVLVDAQTVELNVGASQSRGNP